MHYTTILPHVCIHDVLIGIQLLTTAALVAMRENPLRHQHAKLQIAEMTMEKRPIYARNPDRRLFGVFRELPREGLPCGDRLLVVGVPYHQDCPAAQVEVQAGAVPHQCCGRCRTSMPMEVRIDHRFPLDETETLWKLGRIFHINEASIVNTHPSWLTQDRDEGVAELKSLPSAGSHSPQERGECPRKNCRQPSASTLKLEPLVEALPDMRRYHHLKPVWLPMYVEEHGREPSDIDGSFRHAVETCIKRIERRRREQGRDGRKERP